MLNLATQPFVNRRRFYVLTAAAAIMLSVSLVILAGNIIHTFRSERGTRRDVQKEREEIARLQDEQKRMEAVLLQPRVADIIDRTDFLNALIRQKAISWTRIFMDLENVMPNRVQAVSLRPVIKLPGNALGGKSSSAGLLVPSSGPLYVDLQMTLNCETYENVLEVMRRLEQSPFYDPKPDQENPPGAGGGAGAAIGVSSAPVDKNFTLQLHVNYAQ
jgi:heme exporter protein D